MTKRPYTAGYPAELRERGVRLLREHRSDNSSDNAACRAIAPKLGCAPDSLRVWCRRAERAERDAGERDAGERDAGERDPGERPGLTPAEKDRIKELEREVRELRTANEILKRASACFARAELDRPFRK